MATKIDEEQLMSDMLYRVRAINNMPHDIRASLLDFRVDGYKVGKVNITEDTIIFISPLESRESIFLTTVRHFSIHDKLNIKSKLSIQTGPSWNCRNALQHENNSL